MEAIYPLLFHVFPFVFLLFSTQGTSYGSMEKAETNINEVGIIGAIVDSNSRIGKEERVAMEMAIEDFYTTTNRSLTLHVKNSRGEPNQAAIDAAHLINKQHVRVILGPRTWGETSFVSDIGSHSHTPILSFADSAPEWATTRWPFLIQASHPTQRTQMKAVAAIVKSCGWHRVGVIYEDTDSAANGIFPHLHTSIQEVGAEISNLVALPPFVSNSSFLSRELEKVKTGQCRVIVVHASLPLALGLFKQAKNMGMMEPGYVWITTDSITSLVHSLSSSAISSMQGVIGVKSYFRESGERFNDFSTRFLRKFRAENPEERNHEPGIFALQVYDLTRAVALAMAKGHKEGRKLLDEILSIDSTGLSGEIQFSKAKLAPAQTFQLVNVIGKSYKEIGFWSDGLGFSRTIDGTPNFEDSMENMGQVIWPGEPRLTPKGWTLPTSGKTLRIAVANGSLFNSHYLRVGYDPISNNCTFGGFSVEVFKLTVAHLPYALPYDLILFNGTWDGMLEQVYLKNFDAAIGPVTITSERYKRVDFSQPHADTALVMVVPTQSELGSKAWMFLKPFTKAMWVLTALINVYNGFVIWTIEREHCHELRGSAPNQIGTLLWLAFATLFSLNGGKLHSNLSRMAMLVGLVRVEENKTFGNWKIGREMADRIERASRFERVQLTAEATHDDPTNVSKGAPEFCSVYVISKGKIASVRSATIPVPNPPCPLQNQANPVPSPADARPMPNINARAAERTPFVPRNLTEDTDEIKSPFNRGKASNRPSDLSTTDSDISFWNSGTPSSEWMFASL